jgi:DNA-binding NtrC family response regulator
LKPQTIPFHGFMPVLDSQAQQHGGRSEHNDGKHGSSGLLAELGALFLRRLRESDGINVFDLSPEALRELAARAWPGNVRELQGVIETAAFHAHFRHRNVVEISDLEAGVGAPMPTTSGNHAGQFFHDKVERFKATLIGEALERTGGNQVHAARLLGLDRGTLRRVLSRLATA